MTYTYRKVTFQKTGGHETKPYQGDNLKTLETTDLKAIQTNYTPNPAISLLALVDCWA